MNGIVHLELHTGHRDAACSLYRELCGWRAELVWAAGHPYLTLDVGAPVGGGIVECRVPRPVWLPYVTVNDIGVATDRARSLGASVLLERREGPAGWRSVIQSPVGGEIALWQPKPEAGR